ncbi:two-component system sensor histidine kinase KdpD [Neorhizobium huautlense]|uniref:histidine kinase n=1 Tax=Neorhizobium huautlense TaxID=67774 RepID=A0ABT9PRQ4_9HYPH|nr:sensor histidine kinase KdpD [Neorhizobium huautlense]MDP9837146.1 two-component system sensor histidine kinase KdpD [Neorhizobium huautlense]
MALDDGDRRPSPEALLERAERQGRGRLKIFLGAAPGVGKTYEMLMSGRGRQADGVDVVIGVVETHGRQDTMALLEGFEIIPRRVIDYRGQTLDEMDLDAVLARRPSLVLVDELAHTNAPESRHPKRYLDVLELLSHGIDVYTTLNVQHIESLNDVVAQITRIRVRETVPDSVIDRADDIEIIDITPDDLIKRLHDGKVYMPKTAKRATENYFSPGNLTALRELALRRTAERVDDQLLNHMRAHAISGPWAAGERVLVCLDHGGDGPGLVRYARRQADRLRAPWAAFHLETPRDAMRSEAEKSRLATTMRLAEQLGAETITLPGSRVAAEIIAYAGANNFTHIVIGRSGKSRLMELWQGSVTQDLVRYAGDISLHVISGQQAHATAAGVRTAAPPKPFRWLPYLGSTAFVALAVGVGTLLDKILAVQNLALVFLMAVLVAAVQGGLTAGVYASVLAALCFNFFFLEPRYNFTVRDPESVVALVFFLGVALVASNLAAAVQRQARAARQRAKTTEDLYLFSRKLAGTGTLDDVLWATAFQIASMLKVRVVILLPEAGEIAVKAGYPPDDTLVDADIAAAKWAWEHNRPAGRAADTLPGAKRLYLPLSTGRGAVGVIGLDNDRQGPLLTPEQQRLFDALADQAALAIERVQLVSDVDRARLAAETDRLRGALLSSISHDLKTPLASIMGSAGTLKDFHENLDDAARLELLSTVIDESERLSRFIANLLDMTRLGSGTMEPNYALHFAGDIVGTALSRATKITAGHVMRVSIPQDLPMVKVDAVLLEQVLFNLIDNAAKYAPENTAIEIRGWADGDSIRLAVIDEGSGIPADDLERIFDSFYRVRKGDFVRAGTGLGLSICRGFVEAMGGRIKAANRTDRTGAIFTVSLPIAVQQPISQEIK